MEPYVTNDGRVYQPTQNGQKEMQDWLDKHLDEPTPMWFYRLSGLLADKYTELGREHVKRYLPDDYAFLEKKTDTETRNAISGYYNLIGRQIFAKEWGADRPIKRIRRAQVQRSSARKHDP